MGKKGALISIFSRSRLAVESPNARGGGTASPPWLWPSCRDPQTDSFRGSEDPCTTTTAAGGGGGSRCGPVAARHRKVAAAAGEMYKTLNSVYYFDPNDGEDESCGCLDEAEGLGVVDDGDGFSTTAASEERSEAVIRSLGRTTSSTDRFFFDLQGPATSSILSVAASSPARSTAPATSSSEAEEKPTAALPSESEKLNPDPPRRSGTGTGSSSKALAEESVAVAVDSADPYGDFRASMEEMVAAHGLRGWDAFEELLVWYLRVNAKRNHALIVGAFVDLLLGLAASTPSSTTATTTTTTTTSSSTTSSSASTSSTKSPSTATTTTTSDGGGGGVGVASTAATAERCCGGNEASAPCSSSSSCAPSDQDEAEQED